MGDMPAPRPHFACAELLRGEVREAAVAAAVADRARRRCAARELTGVHQAGAIRGAQDLDGTLRRDLPAQAAVVVEAQASVGRLATEAHDGAAVAREEVDVLLGGDDLFRLREEQVGVAGLVGVGRAPVLECSRFSRIDSA